MVEEVDKLYRHANRFTKRVELKLPKLNILMKTDPSGIPRILRNLNATILTSGETNFKLLQSPVGSQEYFQVAHTLQGAGLEMNEVSISGGQATANRLVRKSWKLGKREEVDDDFGPNEGKTV